MMRFPAPWRLFLVLGLLTLVVGASHNALNAQSPDLELDWPDLYEPTTFPTFHLELTEANWDEIRVDDTHDIEVPTLFWAEQDSAQVPILASVRRKSAEAMPSEDDPVKISLKIDINEYTIEDEDGNEVCEADYGFTDPTCQERWHDVKKLSLENGDDNNVVTEGFAWYLHRLAAESGLDYIAGLANWSKLYITLTDRVDADENPLPDHTFYAGVYVNVEQPDTTYLKHRTAENTYEDLTTDLWQGDDDTWFYEYDDRYSIKYEYAPEDENGEEYGSPFFDAMPYAPFLECGKRGECEQPTEAEFTAELDNYINMEGMLTTGAVSAFHISPDDLFSKAKNFMHVDHSTVAQGKREYVQWDLDSAFSGMDADADIYDVGSRKFDEYEDWIISDNEEFRSRYTEIMDGLVGDDGAFNETDLVAALTTFEGLIGQALADDIYSNCSGYYGCLDNTPSEFFDSFRSFIAARIEGVEDQLPVPTTPPPTPGEGTVHIEDMDGASTKLNKKGDWETTVYVSAADYLHGAVPGATITGDWSGAYEATGVTCLTSTNGLCDVTSGIVSKRAGDSMTFTIRDVSASGLTYDSQFNHDPDGDSNGTAITVAKP